MNQRFGMATRAELVSAIDEFVTQLCVLVNFAVEHDPNRAIFVRNRLVACAEVDNAETAHPDAAGTVGVDTFGIGSTVPNHVGHGAHVGGPRFVVA
jgi:hypothetical protein